MKSFNEKIYSAIKSLYDFLIWLASRKYAMVYLAIFCFAESSFFPIPPYVMILPMVLATPEKAWKIAGVATISSVLGGFLGYAIGYFFFDVVAKPILAYYGYMDNFSQISQGFETYGSGVILIGGLTPIPFKITAILCGLFKMNLFEFGVVSLIARAIRFYLVVYVTKKYGKDVVKYAGLNIKKFSIAFVVVLIFFCIFVKQVIM